MSISIIIPAYNVESYLEEALISVFSQNTSPDEVILVNDGSTDHTLAVAEKFSGCHSNFWIYSTKNHGLGPARNYGLDKTTCDYVYFFDSDDILIPNFISTIFEKISCNLQPDILCFSGKSFLDAGFKSNFLNDYNRNLNETFDSGIEAFKKLFDNKGLKSSACLYVVKREFLYNNFLKFKPILHEDEEILAPLFFLAGKTVVLDDILFLRRVRHGSIMTTNKTIKNILGLEESVRSLICLRENHPEKVALGKVYWKKRGQGLLLNILITKKIIGHKRLSVYFLKLSAGFFDIHFILHIIYLFLPDKLKVVVRNVLGK